MKSSITFFLMASALYALIPVMLLIFEEPPVDSAFGFLFLTVILSVGYVTTRLGEEKVRRALLSKEIFVYSLLAALGFTGFIFLTGLARGGSNPIYTLVIVESWPLLVAVAYPFFRIGQGKPVGAFAIVFALIAILGIALIAIPEMSKQLRSSNADGRLSFSFALPIAAMLSLGLGSIAKAKMTDLCYRMFKVGPIDSFFILYAQSIVFFPFIVPFLEVKTILSFTGFNTVATVFLLNTVSAIFFSFGTLRMKDHKDLFIWFFAPVFSVIFFCIYDQRPPSSLEAAGIALIVGSNLLLSLKTDQRLSYPAAVMSMMIIGVVCVFEPISSLEGYYDILAVLSIFTTITLVFMLDRIANRAENEFALLNSCWSDLQSERTDTKLMELLLKFQSECAPIRIAWLHRKMIQAGATDSLSAKVRELGLSRQRGLTLTNTFSIMASTIALITLAATSRPYGWQHDFFAFLFVPSVVYAFAYLFDLNTSRNTFHVRPLRMPDGQTKITVASTRTRFQRRNSIWSVVLIIFLTFSFTIAFVAKPYGW